MAFSKKVLLPSLLGLTLLSFVDTILITLLATEQSSVKLKDSKLAPPPPPPTPVPQELTTDQRRSSIQQLTDQQIALLAKRSARPRPPASARQKRTY